MIRLSLLLLVASVLCGPALAQIPMTGRFVAEARCPVLQSIRQLTNPGAVATEPGHSYALIGRNADPASHYYIAVPGAEPERRWVAVGCGRIEEDGTRSAERNKTGEGARGRSTAEAGPRPARGSDALAEALGSARRAGPARKARSPAGRYVLAASWHAAFCETRPRARDCRSGGVDSGFSLHGLWPQPIGTEYCDVSPQLVETDRRGDWQALPVPVLSAATRRAVERHMPGARSGLDRHEWWRHGTCYGADADSYFTDAVALLDALNRSDVGQLFATSVGRRLAAGEIRSAFDAAFGAGAGERVEVDCATDGNGRRLLVELNINLAGRVSEASLGELILAADRAGRGCGGGYVDASG